MRYAILSDIHSNIVALEAVVADLADASVDEYLCMGDIVGYGPRPNQCCDLVRELGCRCIRGNHDEAAVDLDKAEWFTPPARACIIWNRRQLRDDNVEFLAGLSPAETIEDRITICHGSVPDQDHYTVTTADAMVSFSVMDTPLAFYGHTHYAEWFAWRRGEALPAENPHPRGGTCVLDDELLYLINPGAVGQPRDGNELAAYGIYDDEDGEISLHRVEYDIAKTTVQMKDAGLPESMHARLWLGV